jgi:nicotinic acid phosphoribosyltransferase
LKANDLVAALSKETILTQVWYPTTVATLSRRTKEIIEVTFEQSVDAEMQFLADPRLHDFGFCGCTSVEQSVIGGVAHLLNFTGSDTMSACWYAQYRLNGGISAIQGDGINFHTVKAILEATLNLGFSAQNVAFGMGGELLQKVDRDTMQFAAKLNYIIYKDGVHRNVIKRPKTDGGKFSLPGILQVRRENDLLWVHPREYNEKVDPATNVLKVRL